MENRNFMAKKMEIIMRKKSSAIIYGLIICLVFSAHGLYAEETPVESSTELTLQMASTMAAKFLVTQRYRFPFLQGTSPLTKGNNIGLALTGEITPVSIGGSVTATITPVAFMEFTAGGRIGSGWNLEGIGAYGMGFNVQPDPDGERKVDGRPFDGLHWSVRTGGAFQFNFAAVFPGDWNNVVIRTFHEIKHAGYSRARAGESWFFENDDGENRNGFIYRGSYLIGYQMPLFLNLAAFLAEADLHLYDTIYRTGRGGSEMRWTLSGVFNFAVHERLNITIVCQFRNLNVGSSNPRRMEFYRVAAVLTYRLR